MASSGRSQFQRRLIEWAAAGLVMGLVVAGLVRLLALPGTAGREPSGLYVVAHHPAGDSPAAGTARIVVVFSEPVDPQSVKEHWSLTPDTAGAFESDGGKVVFTPSEPFAVGQTVRVVVDAGVTSDDGTMETQSTESWSYVVRQPSVAFLAPSQPPHSLWRMAIDGSGARQPIPAADAGLREFSVSPHADLLAFVAANDSGGHDLWTVDLESGQPVRLAACGVDDCLNPVWLPDGDHLAYGRISAEGSTQVWILSLAGGEPARFLDDPQLQAEDPVWSPDGGRVAFDDLTAQAMRVHDFASGHDLSLHTLNGLVGSWSSDGMLIAANVLDISQDPPVGTVYVIDPVNGDAQPIAPPELVDFGDPAWSPAGDWIAVGAQQSASGLDRGIWLIRPDGSELKAVADQPGMTFGGPVWDPWGQTLLFQGVPSESLDSPPDIFMWRMGDDAPHKFVSDAFAPAWLP